MADLATDHEGYTDALRRRFLDAHPEGALGPLDPRVPFRIQKVKVLDDRGHPEKRVYVVYTATAHRGPQDPRPGVGVAWVPVPGGDEITRGREVQVAETIAWGRAIKAVLPVESPRARAVRTTPLTDREITALGHRIDRPTTLGVLRTAAAEVDEAEAQGRIAPETAKDLRERAAATEQRRFAAVPQGAGDGDGKRSMGSTAHPAPAPGDTGISERAKAIANNHAKGEGVKK